MEIKTYFENSEEIMDSIKDFGKLQSSCGEVDTNASTSIKSTEQNSSQFKSQYEIDDSDILDDSEDLNDYDMDDEDEYNTDIEDDTLEEEEDIEDEDDYNTDIEDEDDYNTYIEDDTLEVEEDIEDDTLEVEEDIEDDTSEEDLDDEEDFNDTSEEDLEDEEGMCDTEDEELDTEVEELGEEVPEMEDIRLDEELNVDLNEELDEDLGNEDDVDIEPEMEDISCDEKLELDLSNIEEEVVDEEVMFNNDTGDNLDEEDFANTLDFNEEIKNVDKETSLGIENEGITSSNIVAQSVQDTILDNNMDESKEINPQNVPTDLVQFLRKYPKSEMTFVLKYFSKKEIDRCLLTGKIMKRGKRLFV